MADPVRVFVSHHHSAEENTFTARLVTDLEVAGADVWVDDERITSDDFIKRINEGLAGRQWLVLVMTPDALKSPWVQAEVNAALNQVRKGRMLGVVPIVARHCDDADIPPLWDPLQRYDASSNYNTALAALLKAVGLPTAKGNSTAAGLQVCLRCGKPFYPNQNEPCSYHPTGPVNAGIAGPPAFDYCDVYIYPCCGSRSLSIVGSDGTEYSPHRWPGCKTAESHISMLACSQNSWHKHYVLALGQDTK